MKHRIWINLLIVVALLLGTGMLSPARAETTWEILYVDSIDISGGCTSWDDTCGIRGALSAAVAGDEIWVKAGTYKLTKTTNRTITLNLKNGVEIFGGFIGDETYRDARDENPATNGTVLSGNIGEEGVDSDNLYHVVTASGVDETAVLDGFTITAGNADGDDDPDYHGGGMYIDGGSPTMSNLIFSENSAWDGGGMYIDGGSPTLSNLIFSENSAEIGGGMYINDGSPTLTYVTFSGNESVYLSGGYG